MLRLSTEEAQQTAQRELRSAFKPAESRQLNVDAALNLETASTLVFAGRRYRVRTVSWKDGLELQRMLVRLRDLSDIDADSIDPELPESLERLRQLEVLLGDMFPLFKRLCTPRNIVHRIIWPLINPFAEATQQELGELLGFFCACRTKSSIRYSDKYSDRIPSTSTRSTN